MAHAEANQSIDKSARFADNVANAGANVYANLMSQLAAAVGGGAPAGAADPAIATPNPAEDKAPPSFVSGSFQKAPPSQPPSTAGVPGSNTGLAGGREHPAGGMSSAAGSQPAVLHDSCTAHVQFLFDLRVIVLSQER